MRGFDNSPASMYTTSIEVGTGRPTSGCASCVWRTGGCNHHAQSAQVTGTAMQPAELLQPYHSGGQMLQCELGNIGRGTFAWLHVVVKMSDYNAPHTACVPENATTFSNDFGPVGSRMIVGNPMIPSFVANSASASPSNSPSARRSSHNRPGTWCHSG